MYNIETLKKELKEILSPERYKHSIGVMEKAEELAIIYNLDVKKAALTALAHDIAKEMKTEDMLKYVTINNIKIDSIELDNPSLLHGAIGADICKKKYKFSEDMSKAISVHTTGDENMTEFDKIIFISDKIEKNRDYSPVEEIREIALKDLDKSVLFFLDHHILRMIKKGNIIHPRTILFRNSLIKGRD